VRLLGRSSSGALVFPKHAPSISVLATPRGLRTYKRWIRDAVDGLRHLHSLGIVHRDLSLRNIALELPDPTKVNRDGDEDEEDERVVPKLIIIDLESRWGNRQAPEISPNDDNSTSAADPEAVRWSEKSDIYDLSRLIRSMVYANNPLTDAVEWPVPAPLEAVAAACMRFDPNERPSLDELATMVVGIQHK
jgi:serine/threonine protein kinase